MRSSIEKKSFELPLIITTCGIIFFICCVFSEIEFFSYVALVNFLYYFTFLFKNRPSFFLKYLAFFFMMCSALLGTMIIEFFDIELVELETFSHFSGSLPLILTSYWLLFVTLLFFETKDSKSKITIGNDTPPPYFMKFILFGTIVTFIIYLVMFLSVIERPAFVLNIDRFAYASLFQTNSIIQRFTNQSGNLLLFPLLSLLYGKKRIGYLTLCIYILYFIWIGNKFGPFFTLICIFCLVYYNRIKEKGLISIRSILKKIGSVFVGLLFLTVIIGSFTGLGGSSIDYFFVRTSQQGQEWWKTYDLCKGDFHPSEFQEEINAIVQGQKGAVNNIGKQHGIYRIMYLTTPWTRVDAKLATGAVYTEAGFASAYYYFGFVGTALFAIIMGILIAMTINGFICALNNYDIIKMWILIRFFQIERTGLSMFLFDDLFSLVSIISFLILIFSYGKNFHVIAIKDN